MYRVVINISGHKLCHLIPLLLVHAALCRLPSAAGFPECSSVLNSAGYLADSCTWRQLQHLSGNRTIVPATSAQIPVVLINASTAPVDSGPGTLKLQRLIIAGAKLVPAAVTKRPQLWPFGLFDAAGSSLTIADVRFIVGANDFQQYLQLMQSLPPTTARYHTDGTSFLHIASWKGNAHSVTLISGPCLSANASAYTQFPAAVQAPGCNVRSVDNSTLIPTLLSEGSISTPQPLLVLITANVSLGFGLRPGAISIRRPIVMAGLYSVPTSVDLGMVVNQLNVTSKYSKVFWSSLFLENAAPGDAISSTLSRPMSAAVSANLYAMFCDRLHNCLNTDNVTIVLASQQEADYINYMYSMFNSPLPEMRQVTAFYHTELKCVVLEMGPGPNGMGITLYNLTCGAWRVYDAVFTTQPAVAMKLPFPDGAPTIPAPNKAGPLVQPVRDCQSLVEAMNYTTIESRQHVWILTDNISLAPANNPRCWQNGSLRYPTQVSGQLHDAGLTPSAIAFNFAFKQNALVLPPSADDKFLSFYNLTLGQLPQGPLVNMATSGGRLPPDIFTILLWSVNRSRRGDPVYLSDVAMWLPQPEFDFFAGRAAAASSFAVQLEGNTGDLTFTGAATGSSGFVKVSFDGPGLVGSNVLLQPMPLSAFKGSTPFYWPPEALIGADSRQQRDSLAAGEIVGIAVGVAVGGLLLALVLGIWLRRRRTHRQHGLWLKPAGVKDAAALSRSCSKHSRMSCSIITPDDSGPRGIDEEAAGQEGHLSLDVDSCKDLDSSLPAAKQDPSSLSSIHTGCISPRPLAAAATSSSASGVLPGTSSAAASTSSDSISLGLERWKAAISSTTMQLMERRMQLHGLPSSNNSSSNPSAGPATGVSLRSHKAQAGAAAAAAAMALAVGGRQGHVSAAATPVIGAFAEHAGLQIHQLIGQGSFGSVWIGTWHGKRVAVKIMQLPATGLLSSHPDGQRQQQQQVQNAPNHQANSPPHMAIMEAVVSSTMSHPNVVQVYTYMLNPLFIGSSAQQGQRSAVVEGDGGGNAQGTDAVRGPQPRQQQGRISSWELKLVMEWCNEGTLREALDQRLLLPRAGGRHLPLKVALSLAHDVAAALLHLHDQGVIHGDLKAANVMLTRGGEDQDEDVWTSTLGFKVTAKVADFGMALPLGPTDTHATLAARGTPTHMSPELFMSGHVSKASDIYAYGILLYELISGQRAYTGIPTPLLPHEVAIKGERPRWPGQLPDQFKELQALAVACWAQVPQDRPAIGDVFNVLEMLIHGHPQHKGQSASDLLPQHPQLERPQEQQQQPPPQGSPAAAAVQPIAGRHGMSWSEVTYAAPPPLT